jgi:hypothetical protein
MYQRPVADTLFEWKVVINHTLEANFSLHAANVHERHLPLHIGDLYYLARDSQTHWLTP